MEDQDIWGASNLPWFDWMLKQAVTKLIQRTSDDHNSAHLRETPERFLKAWDFWTSGYADDPRQLLKTFEQNTQQFDTMVFQANIPMWSLCVAGSTFIETPRGRILIQYLKDGDWVYTVAPDTFELGLVQCVNPRMTRRAAKLVRVYTDNDTLLCTPDHKVLTFNRGWVEAQHLENGDSLVSLYRGVHLQEYGKTAYVSLVTRHRFKRDGKTHLSVDGKSSLGIKAARNHVVYGVEHVPWREDVWCMDVPGTETFFANGIAVHNCAHHLAPFWGVAHVGYIPNGSVVGLSKLARVVDVFARRLQTQENIGCQVADLLYDGLSCKGVGVVLQCRHACMESRGVQKAGTITFTSALRGDMKDEPECRAEFMAMVTVAGQGVKGV